MRMSLLARRFIIKMAVETWGVTSVAQRFRQTPSFSKITLAVSVEIGHGRSSLDHSAGIM